MLRKLSSKIATKPSAKVSRSSSKLGAVQGAAVPYNDPSDNADIKVIEPENLPQGDGSLRSHTDSVGDNSLLTNSSADGGEAHLLAEAAKEGDVDSAKQLISSGYDINARDEKGNTALLHAATAGQSRMIRFLLLHGADVETRNKERKAALHLALEHGHVQTVGVLLDYMHSVDNRPREPFTLLRSRHKAKGSSSSEPTYAVEEAQKCSKVLSLKKQEFDLVHLLVAHGQSAEDTAIFLYSILDVPVQHAFFLNINGQLNMKNFQRFESKARSESLTVLNSPVKVLEANGYQTLRMLILVSCQLVKLTLDGLPSLELVDVRHNKLESLPDSLTKCKKLKTIKCAYNHIRRLPSDLDHLCKTLVWVDCSYNFLKRLPAKIVKCVHMRNLYCDHNFLIDLPMDLGLLADLEEFTVDNNKLSQLPLTVSAMKKLLKITFHSNPLQNIPVDFPERVAEVREYLTSLQTDPVPNRIVKLVLVGQEGVGKTTLLKAIKRTFWAIPRSPTTPKTDGVDVKDIQLDELTLRCFDCGGDVDFNETHNFFITQGALYLACFNLAEYCISNIERSSFLLGRLQLWLQYIFSKVPNSQVVIVGTHADHDSISRKVFEEIWEHLRALLINARAHHRSYFSGERLADCLLCQADSRCLRRAADNGGTAGFVNLGFDTQQNPEEETSFTEGPANMMTFPHIMGYYEVSSVKSVGKTPAFNITSNPSIENLKDAIHKLASKIISLNPEIPMRWANVRTSLQSRGEVSQDNCVATLPEIAQIALAHGISSRTELTHMLQFLKAQGSVLYFPQLQELDEMVILDPEWLAKIFSAVVSYRDTGISNEGFIDRSKVKQAWPNMDEGMREKLLSLLHHFGLCLPINGTTLELFPCKLAIGEPDDTVWPVVPPAGMRQLTYSVTFPSMIPPPLFSDLIVSVFRYRAPVGVEKLRYFANHIVDIIRLDRIGCKECRLKPENPKEHEPSLLHQVHYELVAHKRTIYITVRGTLPCCMMRKCGRVLNKVVCTYEGLGNIELDALVCPGCYMQNAKAPHKFNPKTLQREKNAQERIICSNSHVLPDVRGLLTGVIHESCMPAATIKPKAAKEKERLNFAGCPKLFIMLPVNKDGHSFDKDLEIFVSSLMFDGHAVHLLCEFPDGFHLTCAPGYRLKNPKDFVAKFGTHVIAVLKLLRHISESSVSARHATYTRAVSSHIDQIIVDMCGKFSGLKDSTEKLKRPDQLAAYISERGRKFKREDLRQLLHIMDKPDALGPLRRLLYGDQYLWLCNDHYKQLRVLSIGTIGPHGQKESAA